MAALSGCASQRSNLKKKKPLDFETLRQQAQNEVGAKQYWEANQTLQTALSLYPEHKEISHIHLMLGDLYFGQKEYEEADKEYRVYLKQNPTRGEYASYRSILSAFYQTLKLDRDPSPLQKTIKRCKKHLANQIYSTENIVQDVKDILYTAEKRLIDREVHIFDFYLDTEQYASAENRLKELNKFTTEHSEVAPRILYLTAKLDLELKKVPEAEEQLKALLENYPDSQYTHLAQQLLVRNEKKSQGKFIF